jgi:hypothetical protein
VNAFDGQSQLAQRQALLALDAEIATRGRSPELDARRDQVRKVLAGAEADIKGDPLTAALERGVVTRIEPLNLAGGVQGLAQQLQQRSLLADTAATWAGRPVSPFTAQEAQTVGDLFAKMPADQRASGLQLLAGQMTPQQGQALAKQIDGKDRALALALAYGSARTTQGQPTAALIPPCSPSITFCRRGVQWVVACSPISMPIQRRPIL